MSKTKDRLARVKVILKRFRQAVLSAACSGKLTEEWRGACSGESGPSGDSALPNTWSVRALETLCEAGRPISYGVLKPGPFHEGGIPLLRITDIVTGDCVTGDVHRIPRALSREYQRTELRGGEVVISLVGTIGRTAMVSSDLVGANVHRNLGVIAPGPEVTGSYLLLALRSDGVSEQIKSATSGANQPLLNLRDVRIFSIPLPPLAEQTEIVRIVQNLFALAEAIEARLTTASTRAEKLPQTILSKAFKGELVPTEAEMARAAGRSFESAGELLKRVRREHQTTDSKVEKKGQSQRGKRSSKARA